MSMKSTTIIPPSREGASGVLFLPPLLQVCFECVLFPVIADALVTAVYRSSMQGFGMLNDEQGPGWQIDGFTERSFHPFGNTEIVEHRRTIVVVGYDIGFIGRNALDI